jgi:hypothetical protein
VNDYRSVKDSDGIIRILGSYIHGTSRNILLEFADKGTLEEFFKRESPPSHGNGIVKFWEALFQIIKGVQTIHSVRGYALAIGIDLTL